MIPSIEQEIRDLHQLFGSSRDPEGRAFVPLADAYRRFGDLERALSLLEDGAGRHPDLPSALLVEGLVRRDLADPAGAETAFRRVLELDPDNARALFELGGLLARREAAEAEAGEPEAETLLRRGLALDPSLGASPDDGEAEDVGLVDPTDLAPDDDLGADAEVEAALDVVESDDEGPSETDEGDDPWATGGIEIEWEDQEGPELEITDGPELEIMDAAEVEEPAPEADFSDPWTDVPADAEMETAGVETESEPSDPGDRLPTGDVPPEALLMDVTEVASDWVPGEREDDDDEDVLPTRTLGELYARQGLIAEAIAVYDALHARDPTDLESKARLLELQAQHGGTATSDRPLALDIESIVSEEVVHAEPAHDGLSIRDELRALLSWTPDPLESPDDESAS